jgi:sugar phosphate permease
MLVLLFCAALFCLLMVTDGGILTGTIFAVFIFLSMGVIRDKMNLKENQEVKTNSVTYSMFDDTAQKDKQYNIPSFVGSILMDIISNTLKSGLGMAIAVATAIIINIIVIYGFKQTEALPITIGTLISIFIGLTIGIQIDLRNIFTNDKNVSRQTVSDSAVDGFTTAFKEINNLEQTTASTVI